MARRNIKQYEDYFDSFWYIEWLFDEGETTGRYSDKPVRFRGEKNSITAQAFQLLNNLSSVDTSAVIETRFRLPFKKKDKILDNLQKDDNGKWISKALITDVRTERDKDMSMRNLRSTTNDEIFFISVSG